MAPGEGHRRLCYSKCMTRLVLDEANIHPSVAERIDNYHRNTVQEVATAIEENAVVVVGMKGNPHCKKARKLLDAKSAEYTYLEYGSYVKQWRRRSALKMWSGWPTFPMVFHKGRLVGGASDLAALLDANEIEL